MLPPEEWLESWGLLWRLDKTRILTYKRPTLILFSNKNVVIPWHQPSLFIAAGGRFQEGGAPSRAFRDLSISLAHTCLELNTEDVVEGVCTNYRTT